MSEQQLHETTEPMTKKSTKKTRHVRYAAPLGFFVLVFAVIGVISVITGTARWIAGLNDDTALREELYDFLNPVMQFCPANFDDAADDEQGTLLLSAIYRVTEAERIRQLREKDDTCIYEIDTETWRMKIPKETITASFTHLFGKVTPTHQSVGEIEYKADEALYYVPLSISTSGYTPVLGTIRKTEEGYTVEVTYVANADIQIDEKGEAIPPAFSMGKYTQLYTVARTDDGLALQAVDAVD